MSANSTPEGKPPRWRPTKGFWIPIAVLGVIIAGSTLDALTTDQTDSEDSAYSAVDDKYDQTWPEPYDETTCEQWAASMTTHQRWAAAADMLTSARNKGDGGEGLPPDSLIDRFEVDITTGCTPVATLTIADVGANIYLVGRDMYEPENT